MTCYYFQFGTLKIRDFQRPSSALKIMADEGKKEMSIVEHDVLEVYEVEDSALQECMMFVKKMSETSLRELETEKNNLTSLLKEAEKEVTKLKTSSRIASRDVEELTNALKAEKEQRINAEEFAQTARDKLSCLEDELRKNKDSTSALQENNQKAGEKLIEAEELIATLKSEKETLGEELRNLRHLRTQEEQEANKVHKSLLQEREKTLAVEEERDEKILQLNKELAETKEKLEQLKEESAAEVSQLKKKLDLELKMNESLSSEADTCVDDIRKELDKVRRDSTDMQRSKETALDNLTAAEKEILSLKQKLEEEKRRKEELQRESQQGIEETKNQLKRTISENQSLTTEKEEAEKKLHLLESENKELLRSSKELQESVNASRTELAALQEELQTAVKTAEKADEDEPADSWAKRVEDAEDWERKFRELEIDREALKKQFTQVRKHRNRVLRENGGLRRQMSMAGAQLAITNQKFQRQLEHFRTQLNMAEHLYREKMLECNILEVQLKHLMKPSPGAPQTTYDYITNPGNQTHEYIDYGRRVDFPVLPSQQRPRDENARYASQTRQQHVTRHVQQKRAPPVQAADVQAENSQQAEQECGFPDPCPVVYVVAPDNSVDPNSTHCDST